jgi:hypothetical protein
MLGRSLLFYPFYTITITIANTLRKALNEREKRPENVRLPVARAPDGPGHVHIDGLLVNADHGVHRQPSRPAVCGRVQRDLSHGKRGPNSMAKGAC